MKVNEAAGGDLAEGALTSPKASLTSPEGRH
jgi:hypothetical protein